MDWFIHQLNVGLLIIFVMLFLVLRQVKKDPEGVLKWGSILRQLFKK